MEMESVYPAYESYDGEVVARVFEVLDRYFSSIENGTTGFILPDPAYKWKRKIALQEIRELLVELDQYWWNQRGYTPLKGYTAGPELSRLPDNAVWALAQELDSLL